jgi:hypothetical protein
VVEIEKIRASTVIKSDRALPLVLRPSPDPTNGKPAVDNSDIIARGNKREAILRSRQNQGMTEVGRIKTGMHTARMRSIATRKASGVGKDEESLVIVLSCCESVVLLR